MYTSVKELLCVHYIDLQHAHQAFKHQPRSTGFEEFLQTNTKVFHIFQEEALYFNSNHKIIAHIFEKLIFNKLSLYINPFYILSPFHLVLHLTFLLPVIFLNAQIMCFHPFTKAKLQVQFSLIFPRLFKWSTTTSFLVYSIGLTLNALLRFNALIVFQVFQSDY